MKVQVLMSTYNGERYLEPQLKSLFNQKDVDVCVLVRDDGSTDATIDILHAWSLSHDLTYYQGENLKPARSFMHLISRAGEADYYAFCDQDDVWDDDKLMMAIHALKDHKEPALYMSATKIVDENLHYIETKQVNTYHTLENAMIKNEATGCTQVFNDALLKVMQRYTPSFIKMHDSWITRVTYAIGGFVYIDDHAYINYRQHGDNVLGYKEPKLKKLLGQLKEAFGDHVRIRQNIALELLQGYSDLITPEAMPLIKAFSDYPTNKASKRYLLHDPLLKTPYSNINKRIRLAIRLNKF